MQTVTQGRVMEVPKLHALAPKLAFRGNSIIVLKRISVRNLKNTRKLLKHIVFKLKMTILKLTHLGGALSQGRLVAHRERF